VAELSSSELSNFGHSLTIHWAATRRLDRDVLAAAIDT
jgi:galactokinase/mevalonate kinase-like predicted kinase